LIQNGVGNGYTLIYLWTSSSTAITFFFNFGALPNILHYITLGYIVHKASKAANADLYRESKKHGTKLLSISSPNNIDQISKFFQFHWHTRWKIWNKVIIKYLITS